MLTYIFVFQLEVSATRTRVDTVSVTRNTKVTNAPVTPASKVKAAKVSERLVFLNLFDGHISIRPKGIFFSPVKPSRQPKMSDKL